MGPSGMLDVKRIYLVASAALYSFPCDARLGEYALLVKEGPADKVAAIKGSDVHVSVNHLKDLPTSAPSPFEAS